MSNDGGPVFPALAETVRTEDSDRPWDDGLTLRDYFAGQALQGYLASYPSDNDPAQRAVGLANAMYEIADAMLAERGRDE
ncbi:MAG: hypothetical protein GY944_07765 [bacterium]|nr:hypothetical protein [bacterium]